MDQRSATLSAHLTGAPVEARLIEVDIRSLGGSPLLGRRSRLSFNVKLTFVGDEAYATAEPMFDLWAELTVCQSYGAPPRTVGRARLKDPVFVDTNNGGRGRWTRQGELCLELDQRQMDEVEELRAGGGLGFGINLDGVVHLQGTTSRLNPDNHSLYYEVGQSD